MEQTVNRLLKETLVSVRLANISKWERLAQEHADRMAKLPYPVQLDSEVDEYLSQRTSMLYFMLAANQERRKLAQTVRFYLESY